MIVELQDSPLDQILDLHELDQVPRLSQLHRPNEEKRSLIPTPSRIRRTSEIYSLEQFTKPMMRKQIGYGTLWTVESILVDEPKERQSRRN